MSPTRRFWLILALIFTIVTLLPNLVHAGMHNSSQYNFSFADAYSPETGVNNRSDSLIALNVSHKEEDYIELEDFDDANYDFTSVAAIEFPEKN